MGDLLNLLRESYVLDVLDIVIVAFLFYRLYLLVRGTRASEMIVGLGVLFTLSLVAQGLGLLLLNKIIVSLQTVWLIAFIILFQPELRRALGNLGRNRYIRNLLPHADTGTIGELVTAVDNLRRSGLGAIIVLTRNANLKHLVDRATRIEAKATAQLLETIFTPPTPLHDGAVVMRGDTVVAAGVILPLSEKEHLAYTLGTRHRAALGITEQSDAFVVVVSEESRQISVAEHGILRRKLDLEQLRAELMQVYGIQAAPEDPDGTASAGAGAAPAGASAPAGAKPAPPRPVRRSPASTPGDDE